MPPDQPLKFHSSFNNLLDTFRNIIASTTWLKVSINQAEQFYAQDVYILQLTCSVPDQKVRLDKTIFSLVKAEGLGGFAPLYSQTLTNFYRVFTIAIKDIIWKEKSFKNFLQLDELQLLRHLRNASAHNNQFYWGKGRERKSTVSRLPISWRGKVMEEALEGTPAYMEFMKPGDIFLLLSDISALAES